MIGTWSSEGAAKVAMKNWLFGGCAGALALLASPAAAQPISTATSIEEVVVTARRVNENLQTTPVAVTAITANDLARAQITDVSLVQRAAPNVFIAPAIGDPNSAVLNIRGQGQIESLLTLDPPGGIYVDNVYVARSTGALLNLVDVAQVEVLRGPQGTLYGRNTTGGALNIRANRPTGEFEGSVAARIGNYQARELTAVLNVPLVGDELAFRVAAQGSKHDGYARSSVTGRQLADDALGFVRGSLLARPAGQNWSLYLAGDYSHRTNDGQYGKLFSVDPNSVGARVPAVCATPAFAPRCIVSIPGDSLENYLGGDAWTNGASYRSFTNSKTGGISAEVTVELGAVTLKSISAYRESKLDRAQDHDQTPYTILESAGAVRQKQVSEELQLIGKSFNDRLDWIVGGFLFEEKGFDQSASFNVYPLSQLRSLNRVDATNSSKAVYGQATFAVTEKLRATAGLRYTEDKRDTLITNTSTQVLAGTPNNPILGAVSCNLAEVDPGAFCSVTRVPKFDYLSYTFGLDFQATDDIFLYAKTSRASRSGGVNARGTFARSLEPFAPERLTDFEAGAKIDWFDKRLRTNLAAFYGKYENIQRTVSAITPTGALQSFVQNAAKAKIWGVEAELRAAPVRNWTIDASFGWLDYKYDEYTDPGTGADLSDTHFPRAPHITARIETTYTIPLEPGPLSATVGYTYTDAQFGAGENTRAPAYALLNAQASMLFEEPNLEVGVYGRNLTNKTYIEYLQNNSLNPLGYAMGLLGAPRTYGVFAKYTF